ncbi:MAG TPA: hypothetical protein VFA03_17175 [Acetobacteraceae bacterium]|nr:hypothetical protein [Acetobacteraceae bacterium]
MIRPITVLTFGLACGAGLYLYQTKHRVRLLDDAILQTVHETEQVREQERVLRAQWTLLDQPDRLQTLATQFLSLQPTKPAQFTTEADLDARLPAVAQPKPPAPPDAAPVAIPESTPVAAAPTPPERKPAELALVAPPRAAEHPQARAEEHPRPPERTDEPAHPLVGAPQPPRPAPPQLVAARTRPAPPAPVPYVQPQFARPVLQAAAPVPRYAASAPAQVGYGGGSLLGMARSAAPPPPAPAPMPAWTDWNR